MYFVDRSKITATLTYMDQLLLTFEQKQEWNGLLDELALERLALNVVESIIDVGNSMIDGFIMRDPGSYEDILDILLDEKVISRAMHAPLLQVIQLRKMLVREFAFVKHEEISRVLNSALEALNEFTPRVQAYLINELGPVSAFFTGESGMKNYRAYCLDLDGTVYRGKEAVEGAVEFITRLQHSGHEPFYVTNNASKTQQQLAERLTGFGVRADPSRIMSSATAAAKYIRRHFPGKRVYMVGSDGLQEALDQEGISRTDQDADVVLMGMDPDVNFDKLATACLEVRKGAVFVSTNRDLAYPSERGMLPGNGAFTALVAQSTGVDPLFIGKPESHMLDVIMQDWGFRKEEMVMIGDNYDTDIMAGIQFGVDTVHVNTGVTPTAEAVQKELPPTYAIDNLHFWPQ